MNSEKWEKLREGDIIRHVDQSVSMIVMGNYGPLGIVVSSSQLIHNPSEWDFISQAARAPEMKEAIEYALKYCVTCSPKSGSPYLCGPCLKLRSALEEKSAATPSNTAESHHAAIADRREADKMKDESLRLNIVCEITPKEIVGIVAFSCAAGQTYAEPWPTGRYEILEMVERHIVRLGKAATDLFATSISTCTTEEDRERARQLVARFFPELVSP